MSNQVNLSRKSAEDASSAEQRLSALESLSETLEQKAAWNGRGEKRPERTLIATTLAKTVQIAEFLLAEGFDGKVTFEVPGHNLKAKLNELILTERNHIAEEKKASEPDPIQQMQVMMMAMMEKMMSGQQGAPAPTSAPESAPEPDSASNATEG